MEDSKKEAKQAPLSPLKRSATFKMGPNFGSQNPPKTSQEPQVAAGDQIMNLQVLRQMNKKQSSFKLPKGPPRKSPYLPEDNLKPLSKPPISSPLDDAIREAERLLNRQHSKLSMPLDAQELKPVDALVMALERIMVSGTVNIGNMNNTTSENMLNIQMAFQNESPQKMDRCKSMIEYFTEMKSCTQRIVEVHTKGSAVGKSMIGNEDSQSREELAQKLKAKEDECLTLKSRLDRMILSKIELKPLIPGLDIPQTALDIDYTHLINEQQSDFTRCFKFITQISDDIFNQAKSFDSQYQQMQDQFESQLTRLKTIQESIIGENSKLYEQKIELASRVDSMSKNTKYLEDRLATTMTQKEEQIIKLKSEIVIYKSKIVNYKSKLKESINGFETKKIQDFQAEREQEVAALTNQIEQYKNLSQSLTQENQDLLIAKEDALKYREDSENQQKQQLHEQNLIITELSDRLKDIDSEYMQQLSKVDNIREVTQKRLNIEEKERTLNSLKLEYLVSNYRKLQVQKQFLLKALDKDMQSLTRELRKAELEMQRDIYVSSQSAQSRLAGLHNIIKDSLRYVKEVLGFMNFDVDQVRDDIEPKREESGEIVGYMEQEQEDPIERFEKNRLESQSEIHLDPSEEAVTKPLRPLTLEQCFHRHIYELSEVLLSVLGEVFKESKAQTSTDTLQLMDLLQQKTDKKLVREIYKKFFAPARIYFASYINRLGERTLDLQSEKNELRQQVQRLTQQIQEYLNENERQHEEDMMLKQQQQDQHLQEMVEEEIKEQELAHEMASFSPLRGSGPIIRHGNNATNQLHLPSSLREDSTIGDGTNRDQQQQNKASTQLNFKDIFSHLQNQTPSRSPVAAAVASAIFKQQEKRMSEILQIENNALKERVRETRLIFQRQIDELKETQKLEKEKHEGQMSRIKAEYGQDLNALNRNQKIREQTIIQTLEEEQNEEIEKIRMEFTKISQGNIQEYNEKISKLQTLLEIQDKKNEELERELRKLKKLSNNVFQAGWGTFSVVFEETHKKNIFLPSLTSNAIANFGQSLTPKSPLEGLKETLVKKLLRQASREMHDNQSENPLENEDLQPDMPLEKLQHFIEVGFLMDPKGFKFLDCYKEKTFESNLIKHIFEFQDPIDNFKMQQLQNKVKQQITENFALFNEINPVYISLNLGRTDSPFWGDENLSQEKFKLIKREGFYLNGENYVMVNFMKCEQPSYVIRVIAFDNERCLQYSFDLILEDLMMIVDGNMKLLEEDHQNDLCQIILNNLTFIRRKLPQTQKSNTQMDEVSSFTEDNTSISSTPANLSLFIKVNQAKKTPQPHSSSNNHIQGTLAVEHKLFFNEHYRAEYDQRNRVILAKHDKKKKGLVQEQSVATDFEPSMLHESFDLVYSEERIKICDEAEAINLELVRGRMSQHLIVKVDFLESGIKQEIALLSTLISKANLSQQIGSEIIKTQNKSKVLAYVISFEKLQGLDQLIIKLTALQQRDNQITQEFNENRKPTQGYLQYREHISFLVKKSDKQYQKLQKFEILHTEMRALLFQHSYGYAQSILDFGKLQPLTESHIQIPAEFSELHTMHLIYRDFGVLRIKKQSDINPDDADSLHEDDNDDNIASYVNSYAQYAFYENLGCLSQGQIHMHIKLGNDNIELSHQVPIGNILSDKEIEQLKSDPEALCEKIFNQIVIVQNGSSYEITANKNVIPMTDIIEELKKAKFQALIDEEDIIQQEFDAKQIGITLQILAESPKIAQITMINRKVFKILSYFVNNLKNCKTSEETYDWQVIHIDAHLRQQAKSFTITLTHSDLKSLVQRLNNQAAPSFDQQSILSSKAKHEDILSLILDSLVLDEDKQSLKVSTSHLRARILDRKTLNQQFRNCGGRFINRLGSLDKTDQNIYLTSLPQIEVSRKLILNLEKDFADKKYDIKIYESTIKGNLKDKSYHFEMFNIEEPRAIFRAEYFCDSESTGDNFHIERFNIVQQLHQDYEENKFIRDGMVLVIGEKSFPHEIIFLLLEPASNIQWQHIVSSDQLKCNQTRQMKESFIRLVKDKLEQGVLGWKGVFERVNTLSQLGYQKDLISQDQLDLWQGSLTTALKSDQESIYERTLQLPNKQYADLSILSDRKFNQLVFSLEKGQHKIQRSFGYETWRESSRFQSGIITLGQENKMIYTMEVSCGYTPQERAVRFTLYHEQGQQCLVDLVLADKNLLKPINEDMTNQLTVKDEMKFAFSTGFKDSYAAFTKLPDIIPSFKSAFLQLSKPEKSENVKRQQESTSKMLYRKVINIEDLQAIVFVKYDTQDEAETLWKVVIFDQKSQVEEDFEFETQYILTQDELNSLNVKNDRIMRDLAKRVVDKRFVLRLVEDDPNALIKIQDVKDQRKFICYFTEPTAGVAAIQKQIMDFDIRKGFRFSLTNSDNSIPELNLTSEQERLLTQLEKDDLIMDVFEILNSFQLMLRIKTYLRDTLELLSVSDVQEFDIRKELMRDQHSYLMEPHRRVDMAKYIVQNMYYDELRCRVFFLQSQV